MDKDIITINDTKYELIPQGELHEKEPHFKCQCGKTIKKEKNLHKHSMTKSHEKSIINKGIYGKPKRLIS